MENTPRKLPLFCFLEENANGMPIATVRIKAELDNTG